MAFRLIPREEKFFEDFVEMAGEIKKGAALLVEMLEPEHPVWEKAQAIKVVEHRCDEISHDVLQRLHRTFVTPIDREDIHALLRALDDVIDVRTGAGRVAARVAALRGRSQPGHERPSNCLDSRTKLDNHTTGDSAATARKRAGSRAATASAAQPPNPVPYTPIRFESATPRSTNHVALVATAPCTRSVHSAADSAAGAPAPTSISRLAMPRRASACASAS